MDDTMMYSSAVFKVTIKNFQSIFLFFSFSYFIMILTSTFRHFSCLYSQKMRILELHRWEKYIF